MKIKLRMIMALLGLSSASIFSMDVKINPIPSMAIESMGSTIVSRLYPVRDQLEKEKLSPRDRYFFEYIKKHLKDSSIIENLYLDEYQAIAQVMVNEWHIFKDFDFSTIKQSVKNVIMMEAIKIKGCFAYEIITKLDPLLSCIQTLSLDQQQIIASLIVKDWAFFERFNFDNIEQAFKHLIIDQALIDIATWHFNRIVKKLDPTLSFFEQLSEHKQQDAVSLMSEYYSFDYSHLKQSVKDVIILQHIILVSYNVTIVPTSYPEILDFIERLSLENLSLDKQKSVIRWIISCSNPEILAKFDFNNMKQSTKDLFLQWAMIYRKFGLVDRIDPKFSAFLEPFIKKIKEGSDLTNQEKQLLIDAYRRIDLVDLFKNDSTTSVEKVMKSDVTCLSHEKLEKYLPVVAYRKQLCDLSADQERIEFKKKCSKKYSHFHFEPRLVVDPQESLTESLSNKLLKQSGLDKNFFLPTAVAKSGNDFYKAGYVANLKAIGIIPLIKEQERKLEVAGYEPFYSGRNWEWNFVNEVWNMIQAIKQNKYALSDRITMRYRTGSEDINQLQKYRKELIEKGSDYHIGTGFDKKGKETEVTFMNRTIVSNSNYYGECTGTYFLDNTSVAGRGKRIGRVFVEDLFKQEGLEDLYNKYESELNYLYDKHQESSQFGELLCIAIDKKSVDEMVYAAKSGGYKEGNQKPSEYIEASKKRINSESEFIDAEHRFYCLAVTDIPGEYGTREEGGKYFIKSLNLADPEKYAEYQKARDALFEKMRADKNRAS